MILNEYIKGDDFAKRNPGEKNMKTIIKILLLIGALNQISISVYAQTSFQQDMKWADRYLKEKQYDSVISFSEPYLFNSAIKHEDKIHVLDNLARSYVYMDMEIIANLHVVEILTLNEDYKASVNSGRQYKDLVDDIRDELEKKTMNEERVHIQRDLEKASAYFETGQYKKVIKQLEKSLGYRNLSEESKIKIREYLARSHEKIEQEEESGRYIHEILDIDENYKPVYTSRPHYKLMVENIKLEREAGKKITTYVAGKKEEKISEIPASIIIIERREIETSGYMTLQELLESVPGIYTVNHNSESDITLGIRGFWSPFNRNVLIMVNGISMLSERQNDYAFNRINIPVESIDRVEIVRGPLSVIYGAGAFYGVINIITNDISKKGSALNASVGTQSPNNKINMERFNLRIAGERKDIKTVFNVAASHKDGFMYSWDDLISDEKYEENSSLQKYRGQTINKDRYNRKEILLSLSSHYKKFYTNLHYAETERGFSYINQAPGDRNSISSIFALGQIGFKHKLGEKFVADLKGIYSVGRTYGEFRFAEEEEYSPAWDNTNTISFEGDIFYQPGEKLDITAGVKYKSNFVNNSTYDGTGVNLTNWYLGLLEKESLVTSALFTQINYKVSESLRFTAGLRMEKQSPFSMTHKLYQGTDSVSILTDVNDAYTKPYWIPRLAIIYNIHGRQYFKFLYGQAINMPTVVNNTHDIMYYNKQNNSNIPYLVPEEIKTWEINYIVEINKNNHASINLFYNTLTNLIVRQTETSGEDYISTTQNSGQINTRGMEMSFDRKMNQKLSGNISFTYQKSENKDPEMQGDIVSFSPNFLGYFKVNYQIKKNISASLDGKYIGAMHPFYDNAKDETLSTSDNFVRKGYIGQETDSYFITGCNIRVENVFSKTLKPNGLEFTLRVSNLFNVLYHYPTYSNNIWTDKGLNGRGREILLKLGYDF